MSPAPFCATFIQQNIEFFAAVGPVHNSLEDGPYDVQNRQAEQLIRQQHARILFTYVFSLACRRQPDHLRDKRAIGSALPFDGLDCGQVLA